MNFSGAVNGKSRGMTLFEVVASTSVLLLALAMIAGLFQAAVGYGKNDDRLELDQKRLRFAIKLRRALSDSYLGGVTSLYLDGQGQNNLALSLLSSIDSDQKNGWDDSEGLPLFKCYRIFYREKDSGDIKEYIYSISPTSLVSPLPLKTITDELSQAPGQSLASSTTSFQLIDPNKEEVISELTNPLRIRFTVDTARGSPIVTEITHKFISP